MKDCYKHSYLNITLNYDQFAEFKFNKNLWFLYFSIFFTEHLFTSRGTTVLQGTQFGKRCLKSTESENFLWVPDTLWNEQAVGQAGDINILGSSFKQGCIRE
jgi:hypothetical protein